jgi:hypothetical protein
MTQRRVTLRPPDEVRGATTTACRVAPEAPSLGDAPWPRRRSNERETRVIYDHRTYTCRPGTLKAQLALYEQYGWPIQRKHLGDPVLYATTETGDVNSFVHIWGYRDAAERATKRAAMQADPDWQTYLEKSAEAGYLVRQENKILTAVPFASGE